MRYMIMHKVDAAMEAGAMPSQAVITGMGQLVGDMVKSGAFVDAAGLRPSATRVRLSFTRGQRTITRGPLVGKNELVAGFAMLKVKSLDEAIEWASRFADVVGDVEIDVGPVTEPWDLGLCPKPSGDVPLRVLAIHKANASFEAGTPPSTEQLTKMAELTQRMKDAGVFVAAASLAPSSDAKRLKYADGRRTVIDGPFAESKEMIAGFVLLDVQSMDEMLRWSERFAGVIGDVELDVRRVRDVPQPSSGR